MVISLIPLKITTIPRYLAYRAVVTHLLHFVYPFWFLYELLYEREGTIRLTTSDIKKDTYVYASETMHYTMKIRIYVISQMKHSCWFTGKWNKP